MELVGDSVYETLTQELRHLLPAIVPSNIVAEIIYVLVTNKMRISCGEVMEQADIIEIKQR